MSSWAPVRANIVTTLISYWIDFLTSALLSPTPLVRSMIVVVTFPSFITFVDISNCNFNFSCVFVLLATLTSVFVNFRVNIYSNFVFLFPRFCVSRGRGSGRGWCCPDPPHLSVSRPDWGLTSLCSFSLGPPGQVMVHSSLFITVLVTRWWWPSCVCLGVWKAPPIVPGVASQAGHLTRTTQVNLGRPSSGLAGGESWKEIASTYELF